MCIVCPTVATKETNVAHSSATITRRHRKPSLFLSCSMSSISQGQVCLDKFVCFHTEIKVSGKWKLKISRN